MYGPEMWRAHAGVEWSHWDLWFALLCVRDHGGDWDGLDAAITKLGHSDGEAKWSHLLDLRQRLAAVGLSADELVAEAIGGKGLITRARTRVFKQGVTWRDMTPAMRNPPSVRLNNRARYGWWPGFPNSPQEPHGRLVTLLGLDGHCRSKAAADGWATQRLAYDLAEAARSLETGDGPATLAVRRAMLTIGLDLMECCDDSYGALGDVKWHADEARVLNVQAIVAAEALDRFVTTARQLGSASWIACEAMVQTALVHGRLDVVQQTLDAADVPGLHQEWVRKRRVELAGRS